MLVCNYCGRHLKFKYDTCPGCGAASFSQDGNEGMIIIKNPPKDGYQIRLDSYDINRRMINRKKINGQVFLFGCIVLFLILLFFWIQIPGAKDIFVASGFVILPCFIIGITELSSAKREKEILDLELEKISGLKYKGILIKNIPCELIPVIRKIDGSEIYCIKVYYESENGTKIPLYSNVKYSGISNKYNTADLLIDSDDLSKYYIDFEII